MKKSVVYIIMILIFIGCSCKILKLDHDYENKKQIDCDEEIEKLDIIKVNMDKGELIDNFGNKYHLIIGLNGVSQTYYPLLNDSEEIISTSDEGAFFYCDPNHSGDIIVFVANTDQTYERFFKKENVPDYDSFEFVNYNMFVYIDSKNESLMDKYCGEPIGLYGKEAEEFKDYVLQQKLISQKEIIVKEFRQVMCFIPQTDYLVKAVHLVMTENNKWYIQMKGGVDDYHPGVMYAEISEYWLKRLVETSSK